MDDPSGHSGNPVAAVDATVRVGEEAGQIGIVDADEVEARMIVQALDRDAPDPGDPEGSQALAEQITDRSHGGSLPALPRLPASRGDRGSAPRSISNGGRAPAS